MSLKARRAISRKAATARWIRHRFGSPTFVETGLPGGEIVDTGLSDLADGKVSIASLLVSLAAPRLRREGVPLGRTHANAEDRLYDLLARDEEDLAHARYNAHLRQISSFADACRTARLARKRRAP